MSSNEKTKITVFCGAKYGNRPDIFKQAAEELGESIGKNDWELVIGGGRFGMMGAVTAAALEAGISKLHAISTPEIWSEESDPKFVSVLTGEVRDYTNSFLPFLAPNIEARKQALMVKGNALCMAPGATGSLDEFFDFLMRMKQGRIKSRPVIIGNFGGYYEPFKKMFNDIFASGYEDAFFKDIVRFVDNPKDVIPTAKEMLEKGHFEKLPKADIPATRQPIEGFIDAKDKFVVEGKGGFEFYYRLFSSLCLMKTGLAPRKPMVILNENGANDNLINVLNTMSKFEFEKHSAMRYIGVARNKDEIEAIAEKVKARGNKPSFSQSLVNKIIMQQNSR